MTVNVQKTSPLSAAAGAFLRKILRQHGYTQERFAEEFGVSARHVRRWVRDGVHSVDTLEELLSFFNASVKDFFLCEEILDSFFGAFFLQKPAKRTYHVLVRRGRRW